MSMVRAFNKSLTTVLETWLVVAFAPGIMFVCGAVAIAGLLIPDSWMDERAHERINGYLRRGDVSARGKLSDDGSREAEESGGHTQAAGQSESADRGSLVEASVVPPSVDSSQGGNEAGKTLTVEKIKESAEMHVCPWCGSKYGRDKGCECGAIPPQESLPLKTPNKSEQPASGGNEEKNRFLRFFDMFGANFKRG